LNLHVEESAAFRRDVIKRYIWYAKERDVQLAERFQETLNSTISKLISHPEKGPLAWVAKEVLMDIRFYPVDPPFDKLLIFYRVRFETLRLVRLRHGAQHLTGRMLKTP
jgi:plasmid stabilization system protein ParE